MRFGSRDSSGFWRPFVSTSFPGNEVTVASRTSPTQKSQWWIQGRGPGGPVPPLICRQNWNPKSRKKIFWDRASLSQGLDDRSPSPLLFVDQTEARRAEKKFLRPGLLISGSGWPLPAPPLICRPNWDPKSRKKIFWDRASLSQGLDDRSPPAPPIWRSGSATDKHMGSLTKQWLWDGQTVFRPYPRRLESLTVCRCRQR